MSEAERTRRLHVANRLQELRAKHGRAIEDEALPPWLDTLQGFKGLPVVPGGDARESPARALAVEAPAPRSANLSLADLDV